MQDKIKQVIVMRKDLNMRKGKMVAQGSHASISFLIARLREFRNEPVLFEPASVFPKLTFTEEQEHWMFDGSFTKICLGVESEQELLDLEQKALEAGLTCRKIIDSGLTEFDGVPTLTCIAIGPHHSSKIDPMTGHLKPL